MDKDNTTYLRKRKWIIIFITFPILVVFAGLIVFISIRLESDDKKTRSDSNHQ